MTLREDIQGWLDQMAEAYAAGDAAACAGMFTEDATLHSPFAPCAHGRAQIEALHREWTPTATAKLFDILAFGGTGDLAWVLARFSEGETSSGTTLAVLERGEGESWLCRACSLNEEQG
jgi:ketosteroid isomerase-like protein